MKCFQNNCDKEATHIVYWPGQVPPPRYCDEDTIKAQNVLAIMGIRVMVQSINEATK